MFVLKMFRVANDFGCSKGRHNFLLQQEPNEMGHVVVSVVIQIQRGMNGFNGCIRRISNLHPDLIAFSQVERRLEGQRIRSLNGAVFFINITPQDSLIVQKKRTRKRHIFLSNKYSLSREREGINSRSRCRKYPRCQIHGISLVHPRQIERNRSVFCGKKRISLGVEMDGRRFDVDVSDPFLNVYKQTVYD